MWFYLSYDFLAGSKSALDSAGEDESISDEVITPRRGASNRKPPTGSYGSPSRRKSQPVTVVDSDDDDDIMF